MENPTSKHFCRLIRRIQSAENKFSVTLKVNAEEISEAGQQCRAFAAYFEDLAMPKVHPDFDQCYLDLTLHQLDLIHELTECEFDSLPVISEKDLHQAIKSLNNRKSPDEMGLSADHLKYSGAVLLPIIAEIVN